MLVSARATQDDDYLLLEKPKAWARAIRRDVVAVWIAARENTPAVCLLVLALIRSAQACRLPDHALCGEFTEASRG